jgi:hypothetical protein
LFFNFFNFLISNPIVVVAQEEILTGENSNSPQKFTLHHFLHLKTASITHISLHH